MTTQYDNSVKEEKKTKDYNEQYNKKLNRSAKPEKKTIFFELKVDVST